MGRAHSGIPDLADRGVRAVFEPGAADFGNAATERHPGDQVDCDPTGESAGGDEVNAHRSLTVAALLQGLAYAQQQSVTNPAGPQAGRIAGLWWGFVWVTGIIFVIVICTMLWALTRRHRGFEQEPLEQTHLPSGATEQR